MEKLLILGLVVSVFFTLFEVSMILAGVVRIEKHLKTLQEDFRMFINFYLTKKKKNCSITIAKIKVFMLVYIIRIMR